MVRWSFKSRGAQRSRRRLFISGVQTRSWPSFLPAHLRTACAFLPASTLPDPRAPVGVCARGRRAQMPRQSGQAARRRRCSSQQLSARACLLLLAPALLAPVSAGLLTKSEYCSLPLPINSRGLVAEYDVNCNLNISERTWVSRAGTPAAPIQIPLDMPERRHFCYNSINETLGKCVLELAVQGGTNFQLSVPVDISPSVMPNVSVEIFAAVLVVGKTSTSLGGGKSVTYPEMLFSTGSDDLTDIVRPRPRGLLLAASRTATFIQAYAPTVPQNRLLASTYKLYTHILVTFTKATNSSAVYINGVYSDVRVGTTPTIDGYPFININGIFNKTTSDTEITLVYVRVWNRTLSASEARALCSGSATNGAAKATPCETRQRAEGGMGARDVPHTHTHTHTSPTHHPALSPSLLRFGLHTAVLGVNR